MSLLSPDGSARTQPRSLHGDPLDLLTVAAAPRRAAAPYSAARVNTAFAQIRGAFADGTVWKDELRQTAATVVGLRPDERRALVNLMAQHRQGAQSLLDAWMGEVTLGGVGGYGGLPDGERRTLFAHLVAGQDAVNLERIYKGARTRSRGADDGEFQSEFLAQVGRRATLEQRLGLLGRLRDEAIGGDALAARGLAQVLASLPDAAAMRQALALLGRRGTDAAVSGAVVWRNDIVASFTATAVVTRIETQAITAMAELVAAGGNAREKAAFVASAGALLGRLRDADIGASARKAGLRAVSAAMSRVIGSDVNGVIENTLLQNGDQGASSGRAALRHYALALLDTDQGAHLGAITLSLQRGNDLRSDPVAWLSHREKRTGDDVAFVRAGVMGNWLGLVGSAVQSRIGNRDRNAAYSALLFTTSVDVLKEVAGTAFPSFKLPIGIGAAVLKGTVNAALLQWRTDVARKDRDFLHNLYEAALPNHAHGVEARGAWVEAMNNGFNTSLQRP